MSEKLTYYSLPKLLRLIADSIERNKLIVHCRECEHYKDEWCYWRDVEIRADDFCSYGERKDNE